MAIIVDSFDRADSAVTLGNADTGQAWAVLGTTVWGISTNRAYPATVGGANDLAVQDVGSAEIKVEAELYGFAGGALGLAFRVSDIDNYHLASAVPVSNLIQHWELEAGAWTLKEAAAATVADGMVVRVECEGSTVRIYVDEVLKISRTTTFNPTATKVGLYHEGTAAAKYDNFSAMTLLKSFVARGRGVARTFNGYAAQGRGTHQTGYESYAGRWGRGTHRTFASHLARARGTHRVIYESFGGSGRGVHSVISLSVSGRIGGLHRVANDALARYELYRGVNAAPDFTLAPWQTFTVLPFVSPALAAGNTYRFATRQRNAWGLLSANIDETAITVAGDGTQSAVPPSAPTNVAAVPAAGRTVLVTADYAYDADGDNAADAFLVYVRSDGTDPNPAIDTPTELEAVQSDGVAKLEHTTAAFSEGATVKVLVRTRRNGTPDVDSINIDIYTAIATAAGPAVVAPSAVLLGRVLELAQA